MDHKTEIILLHQTFYVAIVFY